MCQSQAPPPAPKEQSAGNLHDEEGGFHLVEVNSPINISTTAWIVLLLVAAAVAAFFIRRHCRREDDKRSSRREGWFDHEDWHRRGRPDIATAHELQPIPSRSSLMAQTNQQPVALPQRPAPAVSPPSAPAAPDMASLLPLLTALSAKNASPPARRSRSRRRSSSLPSRRSYYSDSAASIDSDSTVYSRRHSRPRRTARRPAPSPVPEEDSASATSARASANVLPTISVHTPPPDPLVSFRSTPDSAPAPSACKRNIIDPVSRRTPWSDASEV